MSPGLTLLHRAAVLCALAALLPWLVPNGWMIGRSEQGGLALIPCAEQSNALASLANASAHAMHEHHGDAGAALTHNADHKGHDESADSGCGMAALAAPVLLPATADISHIIEPADIISPIAPNLAPGRGLAAPPPPATGPPHIFS
ncbi:MAG: hypothetical protein ACMVO5_07745 [Polymorphobacter sp.]|uniref:hypothetical protein n=1 Tax=Polymorphobacter sp. TaxID=1909290 RepID=UPI003A855F1C